jgi:hypothetical protein
MARRNSPQQTSQERSWLVSLTLSKEIIMADVEVKVAELQVRTLKLTRNLLKQIPSIDRAPENCMADGKLKADKVVGWIHGSVLGDEWTRYVLLNLGDGEYRLMNWPGFKADQPECKQIYIA